MRPDQAKRAYALYAPVYDRLFGYIFQRGRSATVERLDPQPGERVLEVGVGTGLMLPLYPPHCSVVGVDLSAEMLKVARERVVRGDMLHVALHRMDGAKLAFEDESFDAVIAAYVVTAVPDHRAVLSEMVRVCRPGGTVILTNHFSNGNAVLGRLERMTSPIFEYAGFRTDLTVDDVIDGSGLSVESVESLNLFGFWRIVVCSKAG
jgi:phosphatidylethanolamine/phosphatidyl-N-methylethanolamine N-methyltransferase